MLSNKKAVIFDLDGTLIHSMWVWRELDKEYAAIHNLKPNKDFYKKMEGMSFSEVAKHYVDTFDFGPSVEEVMEDWLKMITHKFKHEVPIKPFVKEMLNHCKEAGLKMGIATSCARDLVLTVLESHGIEEYFDTIVTSCEAGAGKPAPDVYLKAAKELEVDPKDCMVFEDVPNGVRAGKSAGMTACAVEDIENEQLRDELKMLGDFYITSYEDVLNKTYEVL